MNWIVFAITLLAQAAWANPPDARYPGGIARILLSQEVTSAQFEGNSVLITETPEGPSALVGLPLDLTPGTHQLATNLGAITFTVEPKQYLEQRIYLDNDRQVNPQPLDLERIRGEAHNQREAVAAFRAANPDLNLILPVEGPISGPFGKRRFFNDQPRRPHAGTDIAAPLGTPLKAAGAGVIGELYKVTGHGVGDCERVLFYEINGGGEEECSTVTEVRGWVQEFEARNTERIN